MIITSRGDVLRNAIKRHTEALKRLHRDHTVQIFVKQRHPVGTPVPCGTGFFFRCGEEWFLVSAAHVLIELLPNQQPAVGVQMVAEVYLPQAPGTESPAKLIPLRGAMLRGRPEEKLDVAVLRLPREFAKLLGAWRPVTLADVDNEARRDGWYFVAGYPGALSSRSQDGLGFQVTPHSLVMQIDHSCTEEDPITRIALLLDLWDTIGPDGESHGVPPLQGISGAPVWRVFDDDAEHFHPRFVGVETGVAGDSGRFRSVRASRWNVAREVIRVAVPGLLDEAERIIKL